MRRTCRARPRQIAERRLLRFARESRVAGRTDQHEPPRRRQRDVLLQRREPFVAPLARFDQKPAMEKPIRADRRTAAAASQRRQLLRVERLSAAVGVQAGCDRQGQLRARAQTDVLRRGSDDLDLAGGGSSIAQQQASRWARDRARSANGPQAVKRWAARDAQLKPRPIDHRAGPAKLPDRRVAESEQSKMQPAGSDDFDDRWHGQVVGRVAHG